MDRKILICVLLCILSAFSEDVDTKDHSMDECIYTDHWAIELSPDADPYEIAERHGHELIGKVTVLPSVFIYKKKPSTIHGVTHPHHNESMDITWCENQVARMKAKRDGWTAPTDPLYANQWHLHTTTIATIHADLEGAWKQGATGEGVTIAIVDDGLERNHPDLSDNYNADASYDFNFMDNDPYPDTNYDSHGTSCAGAAAAGANAACGVGTAYKAKVSGIRILSAATTDLQESSALGYKSEENFVYSNSWGPYDDGRRLEGPGRLAAAAIEHGVNNGRSGKGSLFVWAAGNGRGSGDNCNYDGWANSRYTMSVAAVTTSGTQSSYSEPCSMLLISCPSSGGSAGITTTDLLGYRGKSGGDCTSGFGGTSAAAPQVAGIVALVIQKNPNLGWRDVQAVLLKSASPIAVHDGDWKVNGGGLKVNHKFGFGLVNASGAVELASTWTNLPVQKTASVRTDDTSIIPEGNFYSSKITVTDDFVVEHVMIKLNAAHPSRGECIIQLVSPSGTVSVLQEKHSDSNKDWDWTFGSIFHWGERSAGEWTLKIQDAVVGNTRTGNHLNQWGLEIYGH